MKRCPFAVAPFLHASCPAVTAAAIVLCLFQTPAVAGDLPPWSPDATVSRDAVPSIYKWNLDQLFVSDAAWEQGRVALLARLPELARFENKLAEPKALRECLDIYFKLHGEANALTLYANLRLATEQSRDDLQAMQQLGLAAMDELMRAAAFIRKEVLALPEQGLAKAHAKEPGLAPYRAYLDNIGRRRAHVLDEQGERVLSLLGDNLWAEIDLNEIPSAHEEAFRNLLSDIPWPKIHDDKGNEVQLTLSNYSRFRASPLREVRREAVTAFLATLRQYQHAFAATLAGQFEIDVAFARARGYDTALQAYLDKDNIEVAVHDNLIAAVGANLEPMHRYVALRKEALDLPDVHLYDLYIPLAEGVAKDVPFTEAVQTIQTALSPLGAEYGKVLAQGLDPRSGWLDLYPSADKESGAFSSSVYGKHPYVKMNYQDSLDDMSTLAHEYGHALHSDLAMKHQSYPDYRYVAFLAEIASTCNEALLSDYLIAHASSDAERMYLLVERLEGIRTTIYRQTMFSEFERKVHEFVEQGTPVTAALLDETYSELLRRYYGPGYTIDENDGMEWAYIPHFYYKYYVYSYATGLVSGIAIADRVRELGQPAVDAYLGMLKGGCVKPPLELLRGAGVDLTKPDAINSALSLFAKTVHELEGMVIK